ncbi:hypothetical protein LX36DRAFT_652763 [Colletotrichum falcatum]|nr:hypothetical protein LX36DRAFT_652763 [Colletotrichum falcatum]
MREKRFRFTIPPKINNLTTSSTADILPSYRHVISTAVTASLVLLSNDPRHPFCPIRARIALGFLVAHHRLPCQQPLN